MTSSRLRNELHLLFDGIAANRIVDFHNYVRYLLWAEADKYDQGGSEEGQQASFIRGYDAELSTVIFLMLYSHLEESLFLWCGVRSSGKSGLSRFNEGLRNLSIDISSDPDWQFCKDAEKIRHCLLHANGRIDLFKNPEEINRIIKKYGDELSVKLKRLRLHGEIVERFRCAIENLARKVYPLSNEENCKSQKS